MFKSAIVEVELGINTWEIKNNIKGNLVELNKVRKQPRRCSGKEDVLISSCSESYQGKFSVKILEKYI